MTEGSESVKNDDQTNESTTPPAPAEHPAAKEAAGDAVADSMDAAISSALDDGAMDDMMATRPHALTQKPIKPGQPLPRQLRTGTIVALHGTDALVEFGPKMQGLCPGNAFSEPPTVGSEREFVLERFDEKEGLYLLTIRGKVGKADMATMQVGQIIKALCTGVNKGGLDMEVAGQRAFMPAGQVDSRPVEDLEPFISQTLECEVIEYNPRRRRVVLSRKKVLDVERREAQKELLGELEVGQTRDATISSVKPYGAFADIGGVDGLIHVSDLSYERVTDPATVVKVGDTIKVKVLKIEGDLNKPRELRIGLGVKQLQEDPYSSGLREIEEGSTVSGKITKIMDFGAFMEVAPGVEGLIHISELAHERVHKVEHIVKADEVVTAKILSIDENTRRIGLSLKALKEAPKGSKKDDSSTERQEDPELRKLKAMLGAKFGEGLVGGLGKIPGED